MASSISSLIITMLLASTRAIRELLEGYLRWHSTDADAPKAKPTQTVPTGGPAKALAPATTAFLITSKLQGQILNVPNLHDIFAHWPSYISPHHDELAEIFNQKLLEWIPDDENLRGKMIAINLPFFACVWHPASSLEALKTFIFYNLWLFIWDDEFEGEATTRMADVRVARLTRETLNFLSQELGLLLRRDDGHDEDDEEYGRDATRNRNRKARGRLLLPPPTRYASIFSPVGDSLSSHSSKNPRIAKSFYDELVFYVDGCAVERLHVKYGTLPSVRDYWEQRLGSSSVYTGCALAEYMIDVKLPESFFETEEMKAMWFETNRNVVLINDILSLKKELKHSAYSLVPITMKETNQDLDAIMADLTAEIRESIANFDRAAQGLLDLCGEHDTDLRASVEAYSNVFRTNMTGNVTWTLAAKRYGVTKCIQVDGSLAIPL